MNCGFGEALNELLNNKCERCGLRVKYNGEKWCKRCQEVFGRLRGRSAKKLAYLFSEAVGDAYINADMDKIDHEYRTVIEALKEDDDLFIWGGVGSGKTYAAAAMIKKYLCDGYTVQRINFDSFCCEVRSTFSKASTTTERDLVQKMVEVDKLFIDDLGLRSHEETSFAYTTLYTIFDGRQCKGLPTYITTNKSVIELGKSFDARIASRLSTAIKINMNGPDRRKV